MKHSPDSQYWFVRMGPIPDKPDWHQKLYNYQAYPFPNYEAARRFAFGARERDWTRDISISHPDGTVEPWPVV